MKIELFDDGVAICGNCTDQSILQEAKKHLGDCGAHLIVTDPPYGNIIEEDWDKWQNGQKKFVDWMIEWTNSYSDLLVENGAFYVWGGYGVPGFRPFFEYSSRLEGETPLKIANFITWSKKRAYGVQHNYLSTREELLYMVKGNVKKPAVFNVPYLDTKRGYSGYNAKYPAKSEYYRRTNVWIDTTEIFSGKVHPAQKPLKVYTVPIEANTRPNDWIVDPFAGSMTAAFAARDTGRKWICIEKDETIFDSAISDLRISKRKR
jgi:site-specific DNA-methyltransferase (adenine-specific)